MKTTAAPDCLRLSAAVTISFMSGFTALSLADRAAGRYAITFGPPHTQVSGPEAAVWAFVRQMGEVS